MNEDDLISGDGSAHCPEPDCDWSVPEGMEYLATAHDCEEWATVDECPLDTLGPYDDLHNQIHYCPFCGGVALNDPDRGVGAAVCVRCDGGFWVEL